MRYSVHVLSMMMMADEEQKTREDRMNKKPLYIRFYNKNILYRKFI